jgi:hypothetical protein
MKVIFKHSIKTFSGEVDDMVYNSCRHDELCIGRDFTYPTLTANNHKIGAVGTNLAIVYRNATAAYKADFKAYADLNGVRPALRKKWLPTGYALFVKMMYAWYDSDPTHVDLSTVTIADISALDADVRSVARAVEAGFLPLLKGSTTLVANIA